MGREEDLKLVETVCSGGDAGRRAFADLLNGPAHPAIWSTARKRGMAYDDVRQELALHLFANDWRVLRTYHGESKLSTWLTTVTYRVCRGPFMREQRFRESLQELQTRAASALSMTPRDEAGDRELKWSKVVSAAENLNERQRILLFAWANGETKPVAEVLGITVTNARVIQHRAIEQLRVWLTDGEADGK